jgi:hypothetical protein
MKRDKKYDEEIHYQIGFSFRRISAVQELLNHCNDIIQEIHLGLSPQDYSEEDEDNEEDDIGLYIITGIINYERCGKPLSVMCPSEVLLLQMCETMLAAATITTRSLM